MDYAKLILIFTGVIYEALPFIVLGVILAGLLEEFVPQQLIARFMPKTKTMIVFAIGAGGLLGLIFPMCECGIIAVMRRLLRKGIPLSVCVCYMLAGPIINVVVMTSTYVAFSGINDSLLQYAVLMRVGMGYVVAFTTSLLVEWQYRKHGSALLVPVVAREAQTPVDSPDGKQPKRTWTQRLSSITETALHDFVDIMAFLVLGAGLAALGRVLVANLAFEDRIREYPVLAIPLMMLFAFVFCLCSEADAFVAANFQPVGLWPSASKLAFLVMGPMLDLKLYMMYTRVFRQRLIWVIFGSVIVQVLCYALLVHQYETDIWEFLRSVLSSSSPTPESQS